MPAARQDTNSARFSGSSLDTETVLRGVPSRIDHARQSKLKAILLAFCVVCFNACGNLSLAWGMKHISDVGVNPAGYIQAMLQPFVAIGIVLLIFWLLTRMALMSWADLSFVQPIMAIAYVVAAGLGKFVLHESVNATQTLGILLIFSGSILVGLTEHRSSPRHAAKHEALP